MIIDNPKDEYKKINPKSYLSINIKINPNISN